MQQVAESTQPWEEVEPELRAGAVERLILEIQSGKNSPEGRAAADRLHSALKFLATSAPTAETRDRLQRLLDERKLDDFVDSSDVPCRAAVINAQLALGYPYALEVGPEELEWLREESRKWGNRLSSTRGWVIGLGALSIAWNGWVGLTVSGEPLLAAPFAVGLVHGICALAAAWTARNMESREQRKVVAFRYRVLGWSWLFGPLFSAIAGMKGGDMGLLLAMFGMVCALPAMITAWTCFAASNRLLPDKPEPPKKTRW